MQDKVFIILNTFNRSHLILETIASIQNQTHKNFLCVIIDDFSTDNTSEVVREFIAKDTRFKYYCKPSSYNKGLSAGRNFGLSLANKIRPDFLQFFDDDDLMHPQKLELQVKSLAKFPDSDFCICEAENFNDLQEITWSENQNFKERLSGQPGESYLIGGLKFVAQVPLFRYNYAQDFQFDEDLFYAEEWVLFSMSFLQKKPTYVFIEKILFYRRKHIHSITENTDPDFVKRKTSAVTGIKLFRFLQDNELHTKVTLLFFTRQFLIYKYDSKILEDIQDEFRSRNKSDYIRFKIALYIHWIFRKILLRILKY